MKIGSWLDRDGRCLFRVWAPMKKTVDLKILSSPERTIPMVREEGGFFSATVDALWEGVTYMYRLDGALDRPDPASQCQPQTVHGPSAVVDQNRFQWHDMHWRGIPLDKMVLYEMHIGAFTSQGTFDAAIAHLDDLNHMGVTTLEIMPVAQFPGERNWGYDGVYPFAVQLSYGGNDGLKRLVDECHCRGMAVLLDVVYNHLGPEGNYIHDFGPYFNPRYNTPWGYALNFDGEYNEGTRNFFIENALYWLEDYHLDGLRLDAVHAITDLSAYPFLRELADTVKDMSEQCGRKLILIAESDLNDSRIIRPSELGGFGFDAQWADDFHHSIHALLTKEKQNYYVDFGETDQLIRVLREGYAYSNRYSSFRKRRHGNSVIDRPPRQFIICIQNHDQVGNREFGERLGTLVNFEKLKLAAGLMLLSPYVPLLFMGEEYGERNPFLYFVSHTDPALIDAVRKGRREEFAFNSKGEPPDPAAVDTFERSKLNWDLRSQGSHRVLLDFYTELISLRHNIPALSSLSRRDLEIRELERGDLVVMQRFDQRTGNSVVCLFNFKEDDIEINPPFPNGVWSKIIDSSEDAWNGPGTKLPSVLDHSNPIVIRRSSVSVYGRELGEVFPADRLIIF